MKHVIVKTLAALWLAVPVWSATIESIVPDIEAMAAHPLVVKAVKEQNAKKLTLEKIQAIDKEWMAADAKTVLPIMKENLEHPAAKELLKMEKAKPYFSECILTDNQGANVAITNRTSDYWQGDEPKFQKAWADGKGDVYFARPKVDDSVGDKLAQVSVPVKDGGTVIGTLTVGVLVNKLQ